MIDRVGEEQRICEKSLELRGLLDRAQVPLLQLVEHRGRNRRVPPHLVQHHATSLTVWRGDFRRGGEARSGGGECVVGGLLAAAERERHIVRPYRRTGFCSV